MIQIESDFAFFNDWLECLLLHYTSRKPTGKRYPALMLTLNYNQSLLTQPLHPIYNTRYASEFWWLMDSSTIHYFDFYISFHIC